MVEFELKSKFVPSPTNEPENEPVTLLPATLESLTNVSTVVLPAFKVLVPMSIAPNPLEMAPEFRVPVVVRLLKVSIAASTVASVVASRASILFNDVVYPPEKILVLPKVISPPDTIKSPASFISPEPVIFANSGLDI